MLNTTRGGDPMRINKQRPPLFLSCYLINLFLFLSSSNLYLTPSPKHFCTSEIKITDFFSTPLLLFPFHTNKEITHPHVTSPPTSTKLRSSQPDTAGRLFHLRTGRRATASFSEAIGVMAGKCTVLFCITAPFTASIPNICSCCAAFDEAFLCLSQICVAFGLSSSRR